MKKLIESVAILPEGRDIDLEDVRSGHRYEVGGSEDRWESEFVRWKLDGSPRMEWDDGEGGVKWEAYMYRGRFAFGSDAEPLVVYGEVR